MLPRGHPALAGGPQPARGPQVPLKSAAYRRLLLGQPELARSLQPLCALPKPLASVSAAAGGLAFVGSALAVRPPLRAPAAAAHVPAALPVRPPPAGVAQGVPAGACRPPLVHGISFLGDSPATFLHGHLTAHGASQRAQKGQAAVPSLGPLPAPPPAPAKRLSTLRAQVSTDGREAVLAYLEGQVFEACVSSIDRSADRYASQLKCFFGFCDVLQVEPLEVSQQMMCGYAQLFRNGRSLCGYLSAVRWFYDVCFQPLAWAGRTLSLVTRGILAGTEPLKKAPAVSWADTAKLYVHARRQGDFLQAYAYSLASAFSLRVPDECLPLCFSDLARHSSLSLDTLPDGRSSILLRLKRRKNARNGASLRRDCACTSGSDCALMCPVRCYKQLLTDTKQSSVPSGRVFQRTNGHLLSESSFTRVLRAHAKSCELPYCDEACSHGFRRGTAQAILKRGGGLSEILASGGWTSSAFLEYLDSATLDSMAVYELFESAMSMEVTDSPIVLPPAKRVKGSASGPLKAGDIRAWCSQNTQAAALENGPLALSEYVELVNPTCD